MTKERKFQIAGLLETPPALLHKAEISKQISGRTILVTGAAGSIGSEIVKISVLINLFHNRHRPLRIITPAPYIL